MDVFFKGRKRGNVTLNKGAGLKVEIREKTFFAVRPADGPDADLVLYIISPFVAGPPEAHEK